MDKKFLARLLCVLIIVILSLSIFAIIMKNKNQNKTKTENQNQFNQEVIIPIDEDIIIPGNSYLFFGKYLHGKVTSKTVYNTINYFAKTVIPQYNKDLKNASDAEISKYYDDNKGEIIKLLDIDNKSDFVKLVKDIIFLNLDEFELEAVNFVEDSFVVNNDSTEAKLIITYKNDRKFETKIKVYKEIQKFNRNIVFY